MSSLLPKKTSLQRPSRTKIVATLGPASQSVEMLEKLVEAGVDVFRINAAHGNIALFAETVRKVRTVEAQIGVPLGILMDLGGPKIRLGVLPNDEITLELGSHIRFEPQQEIPREGVLTCTYEPLLEELMVGDTLVLADGTVRLQVVEKSPNNLWVECEILEGGTVRSRQGVNLPGVKLSIPAMLDVDRENAAWAAKNGVDFLGLSFVRHAGEIQELRNLIQENGGTTQIIAKIEKPEAVENLLDIVRTSDGVMVARGDLGVETDIAEVPILQKQIIELCHEYRKPVIVATQMLESMTHNNFPTRAEVTDVANAILDGTDACMLSGETAVGDFPIETVQMMHRIALGTETHVPAHDDAFISELSSFDPILEATAHSVCELAESVQAKFIVAGTQTGGTALCLSTNRCSVSILGLSHCLDSLRKMALYWGVVPMELPEEVSAPRDVMTYAVTQFCEAGILHSGERVVLLTSLSAQQPHNTIIVHEVP